MNKITRLCSIFFIILGMLILVACSSSNKIKGELTISAKRNELEVTADFEQNKKLEDSGTVVSIKLYNEDESYNTSQNLTLENGIQGKTTFSKLKPDTKYILKLFVAIKGYEEEITSKEAMTKNDGLDEGSAISITSISQFKNISYDAEAYYKLDADLDFKDENSLALFTSSSSAFKGTLDGNGHTIRNIKFSSSQYSGMFGYATDATIKNLNIKDAKLEMTTSLGNSSIHFGIVCGYAENCTLENIKINGLNITNVDGKTFTSSSVKAYIGGMVGLIKTATSKNSKIANCSITNSNIKFTELKAGSSSSSYVYTGLFAGQIIGSTEVENCNVSGTMDLTLNLYTNANLAVGGFVGALSSTKTMLACYSDCVIKGVKVGNNTNGEIAIGGLVGKNPQDGQCNIDNSFAVADIILLSDEAKEGESSKANSIKFANKLYVGGLVGNLLNRSPEGVRNSVYAPKKDGIKVVSQILAIEKNEIEGIITTYSMNLSLTVGNIAKENNLKDKVIDCYASDAAIDLNCTAKLTTTVMKDDKEVEETNDVEDNVKLNEIRNACIDTTKVSQSAKNYLREGMETTFEDVLNQSEE